jgi:hypothetical protein
LAREDYPNAAAVTDRLFSLPLYPKMSEKDLHDVITAVRKIAAAYSIKPDERVGVAAGQLAGVR